MLAFAVDHPTPATVILITGDRDYAYAVSTLKLRKYQVILVVPSSPHTSPSLESQASLVIDWGAAVLRARAEGVNSAQAVRQPYLDLDANLVTKLLRELQLPPLDDSDATLHPYSITSQSTPGVRRTSTRDLLEPSRHSKNTGSFDSTEVLTHTPASPRKPTSTGSDPAPGGPIPKTPSHSRRASVSAGSTRARSTTIVAQSPVVEQDIPAENLPPSSAMGSCTSDITDVVCPAKRSLSVLPSLDAVDLPLHDNGPPSSIIIRSPLKPDQPTGDMPVSGNPGNLSTQKLSCLASPFVMPKTPTGLESISNPCTKQSHTTASPTSPTVTLTRTVTETVTSVCQTPQIKDIGAPKGIERPTGLRIEDNDPDCERSIPHRVHSKEGVCDTCTLKSNYHCHALPHAMYSPSSRNVGTDTSGGHVSPPAGIPLGVDGGVDSAQSAAISSAPNTLDRSAPGSESVLSSSAFPSTPCTTTGSHEHDESERRQMWTMFKPLIHLLLAARESGTTCPSRSTIAVDLVQSDDQVYRRAGVSRFRDYTALAEQAGIIELGGREGDAWIALHPNWSVVISPGAGVGDEVDSAQSAAFSRASDTLDRSSTTSESVLSSSAFPSTPSTTTGSHERDDSERRLCWTMFEPLILLLLAARESGTICPSRSTIASVLVQSDNQVYQRAGVLKFRDYTALAEQAGVIELGGREGGAWIGLHPNWSTAVPPGVGDVVNSAQCAAFSRASDTLDHSSPAPRSESVLSSSTFFSTPSTATGSHEHDESERRQAWTTFKPLVHLLLAARESGITRPSRSTIAVDLVQSDNQVYQRAGVSRFRDYTALAEQAGIIELGGSAGDAWIALHPNWFGVDGITTTPFLSSRVPSPTSDPPKATQNPLVTSSKTPLIETATFQTPTFTLPKSNTPDSYNTSPTLLATDQQDSAFRASVPVRFQPLIYILIRMRAEGSYQTLRSMVGQLLGQDVYARVGVSGFTEYVQQASEARLVQFGGVGGHGWIRLHPELRI
jgi:hypothetical protein